MLPIAYLASVCGAAFNAGSSVAQRLATHKPDPERLFSHRFVYEMVKSRLFLFGFGLQVAGFVAQAVALKNGPLIIVEPLITTDLVFLLLIIRWRLGIHIKLRDWLSVAGIILGLSGLFIAAHPQGGHLNYQALPWIVLDSVLGSSVILLAVIIRKLRSPAIRALLAGFAVAGIYALNAAFTKLTLNLLAKYGLGSMLTSWPIYALIISGIVTIYLMVNAYGSGPLAISQTVMEVFEPSMAVVIGIFIFGDSFRSTISALAIGSICVAVLTAGIISLASSPRIHQAGEQGI